MAIDFNIFNSPDFQNKWAYSDRSQQSLGLDDETYKYLKDSNFQPFQPTADTNIQNFDGVWKNTVVQPGQTQQDFKPVTSTPATGLQSAYGANIAQTLPGGTSSILPPKQPASSIYGGGQDQWESAQPVPSTWPSPGGSSSGGLSGALSGRRGQLGAITGNPSGSQPLPGLPGDTATGGYVDPTTGRWVEQSAQGGGQNGLSDVLSGRRNQLGTITGGTTPGSTDTSSPNPRDARYEAESAATGLTSGRSAILQSILASAPLPGGSTPGAPGTPPTGTGATPGGTTTPGGLPSQGTLPPGSESRFFPDDPQSRFDNGLGLPRTSIRPEDVMLDPGYKWQKEQLDRMLEDRFAAKGRVGSTDYFNTGRNQDMDLVSREFNRINNQQWDRGMEMNRLLYDRRVQEDFTAYEREFRENERQYGREKAEEILAYERAFRKEAQEYDRYRWMVELGFRATESSPGT